MEKKRRRPSRTALTVASQATVKDLVVYIETVWQRECSDNSVYLAATEGDIGSVREVLEEFRLRFDDNSIGVTSQDSQLDRFQLLIAMDRLVAAMLEQTDSVLRRAFGQQLVRKGAAERRLHRTIHYAVDHAQFNMGEWRTLEAACELVAEALRRLPSITGELDQVNVKQIYRRMADRM